MVYSYEGDVFFGVLAALAASVPSAVMCIAIYVMTAAVMYTVARRRQLRKPWLAWIPVVNVWLLGSLSDQYRYVVKGENRAKRKLLLVLGILKQLMTMAMSALCIAAITTVIFGGHRHQAGLWRELLGPLTAMVGLGLPLAGVAIAYIVIRFMALYDVYKSMDPNNAGLFLVLSILIRPTEAFFLFFNRDKEKGMPPRRQETVDVPPQEPWEAETKDYL